MQEPYIRAIYSSIYLSASHLVGRARVRGYNRRLKECLMSQTSHVRAIISIGTAYKDCRRRRAGGGRSRGEKGGEKRGIERAGG